MKKFTFGALFMLISVLASAHTLTSPSCPIAGRVRVDCGEFTTAFNTNYIRVHINTPGVTWANGTQDTVFAEIETFTIYIPQPSQAIATSVTFYNQRHIGHGSNQCQHTYEPNNYTTAICDDLPLDITERSATWVDKYTIDFTFKVEMVQGDSNVDFYIQARNNSVKYPKVTYTVKDGRTGRYVIRVRYNSLGQWAVIKETVID